MDDHGHGTQMAGIIGSSDASLTGMAPECRFLACKVLDKMGSGKTDWVLAALDLAADPDQDGNFADAVQVVNISFSGPGHSDAPVCRALDELAAAGVVCVGAAGSAGSGRWPGVPAAASMAITVGSASRTDVVSDFSMPGPALPSGHLKPDLCAPGEGIHTLNLSGQTVVSGTSAAAAHVSGAAAMLREMFPA